MVAQWLWTLTRSPVVRYRGTGQLECVRGAKNEINKTNEQKGQLIKLNGVKAWNLVKRWERKGNLS